MVSNGRGLVTLLVVNLVLSVTLPNISFIGHIAGIVAGIIAGIAILTLEEKGKLVWIVYKKKF